MPTDSLMPLSCGACGAPARVNVAGLHMAVSFTCGWCGKRTMVRCVERPAVVMPATCGAAAVKPNDSVASAFAHWRRDPAADAREDCNIAYYPRRAR